MLRASGRRARPWASKPLHVWPQLLAPHWRSCSSSAPLDLPLQLSAGGGGGASGVAGSGVGRVTVPLGGRELVLQAGRVGPLADGTVLARLGDTSVLVSAVCSWRPADGDFLPLQVDYREKASAGGVIPSTYSRREAGQSDRETLAARLVDRAVRPLFAKGFAYDTQLICSLTSFDRDADPAMLAVIAASAALHVSSVPWRGPVAGVRVGWLAGAPVLAPSHAEEEASALSLLYAGCGGGGTAGDRAVMMEVGAEEISEADLIIAMRFARAACAPLLRAQEALRAAAGKAKKDLPLFETPADLLAAVRELIWEDARAMFSSHGFSSNRLPLNQ